MAIFGAEKKKLLDQQEIALMLLLKEKWCEFGE